VESIEVFINAFISNPARSCEIKLMSGRSVLIRLGGVVDGPILILTCVGRDRLKPGPPCVVPVPFIIFSDAGTPHWRITMTGECRLLAVKFQKSFSRERTVAALQKAKGAFVSESALHIFDGDKPNSVRPIS
jgi:hypothetical protein